MANLGQTDVCPEGETVDIPSGHSYGTPTRLSPSGTPTWAELRQASMGYLTAQPITKAAELLVDEVYQPVSSAEVRERKRGKAATAKLRRAIGALLGDLLIHHPGLTFVPRNNAEFSGMEVKAWTFDACLKGLLKADLVRQHAGFRSKGLLWAKDVASGFGPGWAMRIWPSPGLVRMAEAHGVLPDASKHFRRPPPPVTRVRSVVLRKRGSATRMTKGMRMRRPQGDARLERIRDEVMEVNRALASADVQGCEPPILFRSFTLTYGSDGGPPLHGRWYATGSDSYIRMRAEDRQRITIGGEPVAEVDVSASFFWCFYGVAERLGAVSAIPASGTDLYAVSGLPRAVVKRFMTATWGNGHLPARWPKGTKEAFADDGIKLKRWPLAKVREEVLKTHPVLRRLHDVLRAVGLHGFEPKEPHKLCSHWLMGIEAEAVTRALLRMLREDAVVAMPLHDCLLVRARMADAAVFRLKEAYREVAGVEPVVKIKGQTA